MDIVSAVKDVVTEGTYHWMNLPHKKVFAAIYLQDFRNSTNLMQRTTDFARDSIEGGLKRTAVLFYMLGKGV